MTPEEQKQIFSRNLNYFIALSGKQQTEIAKAIGEKLTTFNMWTRGKSLPSVPKIQKLADYFGIGKSDLVDDKGQAPQNASYGDVVHFLGRTDPHFARIAMDYFKKDPETRKSLCDFYEKFIMDSK